MDRIARSGRAWHSMDGLPNTLYPVQSLNSVPLLELSIQYSSSDGHSSVLYVMPFWLAEDVDWQTREVILSYADTFFASGGC